MTTLKCKNIQLNIETYHNKKFQCAVVCIFIKTTESKLLATLCDKFAYAKVLRSGINPNTHAYSVVSGPNGMVINCPENKINSVITIALSYLAKTTAKVEGSYDKLMNDMKNVSITITGKCKNYARALETNAPKIERLKTSVSAIDFKKRDAFPKEKVKLQEMSISFQGCCKCALYASIILSSVPCKITHSNNTVTITLYNNCGFIHRDMMREKIKSFLSQTGAVGSPAANDTNQTKYKEKCKYILTSQNVLAKIYSSVRGFSCSFENANELKSVDGTIVAVVTKALKELLI